MAGQSKAKKSPRLFILDGHALCYRAYYAIRELSNSRGEPTNAIYGFVSMVRRLLEEQQPDSLAICFDRKEPTFRHEKFEDYKAHRKPMPDDLVDQIEPIKEFCRASGFTMVEKAGFEADDLIGTLAKKGAEQGLEVYIVTGDKDALQLVDDRIRILNPHKENLILDTKSVCKKFDGLGPERVVDVMALMGDASDNIPGVPGIGEKTAVKLINQFGSLEKLFEKVDEVKSKSQKALLKEHEDKALLSKELVTIDTDVPVNIDWKALEIKDTDTADLQEFYKYYEFNRFLKELTPSGGADDDKERNYRLVRSEKELKNLIEQLKKAKLFSFDTETTSSDPMRAELVGMSFSRKAYEAFYVPLKPEHSGSEGIDLEKALKLLKPLLEDSKQKKAGQNFKYDWIVMKRHGIEVSGLGFDTMIASYLINPIKFNHNLDDISLQYLGIKKIATEELIGKGKQQVSMADVPVEKVCEYACEDADCVMRLVPILRKRLDELDLSVLFEKTELPLSLVLGKVEMNGVNLDIKFLEKMSEKAGEDLERLTKDICKEAGEDFNINSPKQLSEILFEKLKLPVVKKTKSGYSTDVSVLEKLAVEYELPKMVLEYREKAKLKSTYLDALPAMVNPSTRRIHTSYHQTTTATGRLSSTEPNLQNIPIKTEAGRQIRKGFIPSLKGPKGKILSADYSQIELRVLAHFSDDSNLTKAFNEDRDIHRFTATLLYGVKEDKVTYEMRNVAKTINFSIIYGKTAYGLAQDLNISVPEADEFIGNYFKRYKRIKQYLESQKEKAREQGYLTTLLGRRAYFPEINSRNGMRRQFAERAAINAPIQGTAADLIKVAMIRVQDRLEKEAFKSLMTMQVHDELVFDTTAGEIDRLSEMVRGEMEQACSLKVALKADVSVGDTWYKN